MELAYTIQNSALPKNFNFPGHDEFELYATMDPAREVGGDFYDFFFVDDDHIALVMADVSGKGIPAALFMMVARTLIKNRTMMGGTPSEILYDVNNQLCEGNVAGLFVTVWLGILEISTGKITASNAGHEFPVIRKANGDFEVFKDEHGFVIGGMEDMTFDEYELTLEKGGMLFVYTDGVPEATNASEEMFGIDRLVSSLNENKSNDVPTTLDHVTACVDKFVGGAEQFDDLTMLAVTLK